MIKIGIAGCAGKMGRTLVQETLASPDLVLSAATVSPKSEWANTDVGTLVGRAPLELLPVHDLNDAIDNIDVLIDFTTPTATLSHLALCVTHGKKMVIGTTGLTSEQKQELIAAAKIIPIVFAPNMSVGLNLCLELIQTIAKKIDEADIHISEAHHRHKKDSPSGTSLIIENTLHKVLPDKTIGHSSIRAGEIVGDHTVLFALAGESIEITHRAFNRNIFAKGALRCARWLNTQAPGLYTMQDVLA